MSRSQSNDTTRKTGAKAPNQTAASTQSNAPERTQKIPLPPPVPQATRAPTKTLPLPMQPLAPKGPPATGVAQPPPLPGGHASPAPTAAGQAAPVVLGRVLDAPLGAPPKSRPAVPPVHVGPPASTQPAASPDAQEGAGSSPSSPPALQLEALSELIEAAPKTSRRSSLRPPAPETTANGRSGSIADTFERLLSDDLDANFAALEGTSGDAPKPEARDDSDLEEVRQLFAQLVANHMRQVRDFMLEVRWGNATTDWIGICDPAVRSLQRAADKLEFVALRDALERFAGALDAARAGGRVIEGEVRDLVLARYDELAQMMPQAFSLDMDRSQRETVILQSLLARIPDVKKVTIDKLYAAGLTTLETMFLATPDDIVATTGIARQLAERIVTRFREYRDEVQATAPDATRAFERERLAELVVRMRAEHEEFEQVSQAWSEDATARKKQLRQSRAQTLLDINVLLARLGEVDLLRELERLPFERKLARLETFLEEARGKYLPQP